ncbi:hypothetical protein AVEN_153356-1 [Araneus ventricosus]|uniref:Uncharacterized protein n=1 Tax=Araneus ventricosus TaxID=182803 RepID=A0A4Y2VNE7_ARAVE|nr:hypothetical protein AVEN_153356-1 [Araneus ventricosus]
MTVTSREPGSLGIGEERYSHESEAELQKRPSPPGGTTSSKMRSRRISKRVLASLLCIVMVWVELPHSDDGMYLLRERFGPWPVIAVKIPTSVSERSWWSFVI